MEWLTHQHPEKKSVGTGLLLAPLAGVPGKKLKPESPEDQSKNNVIIENIGQESVLSPVNISNKNFINARINDEGNNFKSGHENNLNSGTENIFILDNVTSENNTNLISENENNLNSETENIFIPDNVTSENNTNLTSEDENNLNSETENIFIPDNTADESNTNFANDHETNSEIFNDDADLNEFKSGDELNLNIENSYRESIVQDEEPPAELWTDIPAPEPDTNAQIEESELKRNNKFIDKLQQVLKLRKNIAAENKNNEPEKNLSYLPRIVLLCSLLLIALGGAYLALYIVKQNLPENLNLRAEKLYNSGNFDEAMKLYQRGYKLYPDQILFLSGIAKSASKSGKIQTANIAWSEYLNAVNNKSEDLNNKNINVNNKNNKILNEPEKNNINAPNKKYSFRELLKKGSDNLTYKHYDEALQDFTQAMKLNNKDVRPYLGISAAYKGKNMKFEAVRILYQAQKKFRHPNIEVELYLLTRGE